MSVDFVADVLEMIERQEEADGESKKAFECAYSGCPHAATKVVQVAGMWAYVCERHHYFFWQEIFRKTPEQNRVIAQQIQKGLSESFVR